MKIKFSTKVLLFFAIAVVVYYFIMYGGNNSYTSSELKISMAQEQIQEENSESSSDINNTEDEMTNSEEVSEEESQPSQTESTSVPEQKTYNLDTAEGREEYVWDFLIRCGFSQVQAAGIVGNMRGENSGLKTSMEEAGNHIGYGIIQWSFGRRDNLFAFAREKGMSASSLDLQLMFFLHEYNTTGWAGHKTDRTTFKNTDSVYTATKSFMDGFERPGIERFNVRLDYAQKAYEKYAR